MTDLAENLQTLTQDAPAAAPPVEQTQQAAVESQPYVIPEDGDEFDKFLAGYKDGTIKVEFAAEPAVADPDVSAAGPAQAETPPAKVEDDPAGQSTTEESATETAESKRFRLLATNPKDTAVFAVMKANRIGYDEAAAMIFGAAAPSAQNAAPAETAKPEETSQAQVETVEALDAKIQQLRAERKAAMSSLQLERVAELDEELFELPARRAELAAQQATAAAQAVQAVNQQQLASEAKAVSLYPDAAVPTSPLYQRAEQIIDVMRANGDPTLGNPDVVLRVVQMAAAELSIAPSVGQPAAKSNPAPTAAPVVRMRPASAAAGSGVANPATEAQALQALDNLSLDELRDVARRYGR